MYVDVCECHIACLAFPRFLTDTQCTELRRYLAANAHNHMLPSCRSHLKMESPDGVTFEFILLLMLTSIWNIFFCIFICSLCLGMLYGFSKKLRRRKSNGMEMNRIYRGLEEFCWSAYKSIDCRGDRQMAPHTHTAQPKTDFHRSQPHSKRTHARFCAPLNIPHWQFIRLLLKFSIPTNLLFVVGCNPIQQYTAYI